MAENARARSMGPTQLIAWLVCLILSFIAVLLGLMSMYETRVLRKKVDGAQGQQWDASRELRREQVELLRDIRDLLGGGETEASMGQEDSAMEDTAVVE